MWATISQNEVNPTHRCHRVSRSWPIDRSMNGTRAIASTWSSSRSALIRPLSRPIVVIELAASEVRSWTPPWLHPQRHDDQHRRPHHEAHGVRPPARSIGRAQAEQRRRRPRRWPCARARHDPDACRESGSRLAVLRAVATGFMSVTLPDQPGRRPERHLGLTGTCRRRSPGRAPRTPACGVCVRLVADPPCGVISLNSPRAGRQQGQAGSGGCAGGPCMPDGSGPARREPAGPRLSAARAGRGGWRSGRRRPRP